METIIIWIVIIAVVTIFERIKQRDASTKDEQRQPGHIPRPTSFDLLDANDTTAPQLTETRQPVARQPETRKPAQAMTNAYRPLPAVHDDNDSPMLVENLDADNEISPKSNIPSDIINDRQAHYDRWRRAVIDMQILERKF